MAKARNKVEEKPPLPAASQEAVAVFVAGVGREISETWGRVSALAGRVFALLFMAGRPMTLDEMAEQLGRSKSNVLVNVRTLVELGLASPAWVPDSRRDHYQVADDFGNIVMRAFMRRLGDNLAGNRRVVEQTKRLLDALPDDDQNDAALAAMRTRVETASRFYVTMGSLYENFAGVGGIDTDFVALLGAVAGWLDAAKETPPEGETS